MWWSTCDMAIATLNWISRMTTHCPFSLDNGSACLVIGEHVGCIRWSFIGRQNGREGEDQDDFPWQWAG